MPATKCMYFNTYFVLSDLELRSRRCSDLAATPHTYPTSCAPGSARGSPPPLCALTPARPPTHTPVRPPCPPTAPSHCHAYCALTLPSTPSPVGRSVQGPVQWPCSLVGGCAVYRARVWCVKRNRRLTICTAGRAPSRRTVQSASVCTDVYGCGMAAPRERARISMRQG